MSSKKLCGLSVDLDPLTAYYEIHGLGDPPLKLRHTILKNALPRFEELFEEAGVPATFFVVGRELEGSEEAQEIVARMVRSGHEMGNHTYTHPYDLRKLPEQVIDAEIRKAHHVITSVVGAEYAPVGFRTPGYGANHNIMKALSNHGYRYDSSMFPSPPYFVAKMIVMAGMALRGHSSGATLNDPRTLACPADPYRPSHTRPWKRGQSPMVELPIAVLPWIRLPAIGTFLAVSPPRVRRIIIEAMKSRRFFNLELHGIDLADAIIDRIPTELAGRQPDLRVPFDEKRKIFIRTLQELKQEYDFVTLREAAAIVQREGSL